MLAGNSLVTGYLFLFEEPEWTVLCIRYSSFVSRQNVPLKRNATFVTMLAFQRRWKKCVMQVGMQGTDKRALMASYFLRKIKSVLRWRLYEQKQCRAFSGKQQRLKKKKKKFEALFLRSSFINVKDKSKSWSVAFLFPTSVTLKGIWKLSSGKKCVLLYV